MKIINTPIDGLKININKVIGDKRGVLCEILPDGTNNKFLNHKIGNIYASIATGREARAGHYHFKNIENFYTLSGTALWIFKDYRKESPTFEKTYDVILGFDNVKVKDTESYTIDNNYMAQVMIPAGVYHVFYPMTETPVTVLAIASEPHDDKDYARIKPEEIPEIKDIMKKLNFKNSSL